MEGVSIRMVVHLVHAEEGADSNEVTTIISEMKMILCVELQRANASSAGELRD